MTICRHASDCNCSREEQLQNLDMVYAGQGLYTKTLNDLVKFFITCEEDHCLRIGGVDFCFVLNFEMKIILL